MPLSYQTIVDISLELDPKSYSMRTPAGFKKDMQFEMEVLKEHDAAEGAGQVVRLPVHRRSGRGDCRQWGRRRHHREPSTIWLCCQTDGTKSGIRLLLFN